MTSADQELLAERALPMPTISIDRPFCPSSHEQHICFPFLYDFIRPSIRDSLASVDMASLSVHFRFYGIKLPYCTAMISSAAQCASAYRNLQTNGEGKRCAEFHDFDLFISFMSRSSLIGQAASDENAAIEQYQFDVIVIGSGPGGG